ncbi:hypothetical protein IMZ48_05990 [Candidatus Bathyarchaeota archaeon]|nr:hypothetical protein [Candidatus Bathyarchaeota archaeon]
MANPRGGLRAPLLRNHLHRRNISRATKMKLSTARTSPGENPITMPNPAMSGSARNCPRPTEP